jgi:hypothetical protein
LTGFPPHAVRARFFAITPAPASRRLRTGSIMRTANDLANAAFKRDPLVGGTRRE